MLLALPALAQTGATQERRTPTFDSGIGVVLVDVVVTDGEGLPAVGLAREDFRVREDGQRREITYFLERQLPGPPPGPRPWRGARVPLIQTNQPVQEEPRPEFLIVFDELHLAPETARLAREALASFFDSEQASGARVTLLSSARPGRWWANLPEGLEDLRVFLAQLDGRRPRDRSSSRMGDYEAFLIHRGLDPRAESRALNRMYYLDAATNPCDINRYDPVHHCRPDLTIGLGVIRAKASETYLEASWRIDGVMQSLESLLRGLEGSPVRRSVLFVSEGFIQDQPPRPSSRAVRAAAARANAAVYFLDARLLDGALWTHDASIGPAAEVRDHSDTLGEWTFESIGTKSLAVDTGGLVLGNANDLSRGLERVMRETAHYYLLGYPHDDGPLDGRYHKIEVQVTRPGLKARARKGYYAGSQEEEQEDPGFQGVRFAAQSPVIHSSIPLRAAAYIGEPRPGGKVAVLLVVEADSRALSATEGPEDAPARLETAMVVYDRDGGIAFEQLRALEARPDRSDRPTAPRSWIRLVRDLELDSGIYQARLVLRDTASGARGSLLYRLEVPPARAPRLLTPIVTDVVSDGGPGRGPQAVPVAHRRFGSNGALACQLQVFTGTEDTQPSPVQAAFQIADGSGAILVATAPQALAPSGPGLLGRLFVVPMAGVPPGNYEIRIQLLPSAPGNVVVREPFLVETRVSNTTASQDQ